MILKLTDTIFSSEIIKRVIKPYGTLYFLDEIFVVEIKEGINFVWEYQEDVINHLDFFYAERLHKVIYVSNRVNCFYYNPSNWIKLKRSNIGIKGIAIVSDVPCDTAERIVESMFLPADVKYHSCIMDAFQWAAMIKEKEFLAIG